MLKSQIIPELHGLQPRVIFQLDGALSHLSSGLRIRKDLDDEFPKGAFKYDIPP